MNLSAHGRQQVCRMARLLAGVGVSVTFLCTQVQGWALGALSALVVASVEAGVRERRPVRLVRRRSATPAGETGRVAPPRLPINVR